MRERRARRRTEEEDEAPRRSRSAPKEAPNTPMMFRGLSSRMESKGGGGQFSLKFEYGKGCLVQFLTDPSGFLEFEQHQFNAGGWKYVPCLGKGCPLCDDEDKEVSKTTYRFVAVVWSFDDKEVRIMEGPKTLAQRIAFRWAKRKDTFTKRTFEVTKLKQTPVSYDVDVSDEVAISTRTLTIPDLEDYVKDSAARFFGNEDQRGAGSDKPARSNKSSLDADDEEDDIEDDVAHTRAELSEMTSPQLKSLARTLRINPTKFTSRSELIRAIMKKEQ